MRIRRNRPRRRCHRQHHHSHLPAPSTPAAPQLLPLLRGARVGRHARLGCSPLLSLGAFVLVQLFGGIADEHGRAEPGRGDTRVARSAARERQQRDARLCGLQVHAAQRYLHARVGRVRAPPRRSAQLDNDNGSNDDGSEHEWCARLRVDRAQVLLGISQDVADLCFLALARVSLQHLNRHLKASRLRVKMCICV